MIVGWFLAAAAVFSLSDGIIHTYYLSALAPATGALVGAGAVACGATRAAADSASRCRSPRSCSRAGSRSRCSAAPGTCRGCRRS